MMLEKEFFNFFKSSIKIIQVMGFPVSFINFRVYPIYYKNFEQVWLNEVWIRVLKKKIFYFFEVRVKSAKF